jgi:N-acetylmuramoyl-L-alanine amidase
MKIKDIKKPKRKITKISVHCSDSDYPHHDNVETLTDWHVNGNGWKSVGYHFIITKQKPRCRAGRDLEITPAAVYGHNTGMIAICLTGKYKFSKSQFKRLRELIRHIESWYDYKLEIKEHRYWDNGRSCPNFKLKDVLKPS